MAINCPLDFMSGDYIGHVCVKTSCPNFYCPSINDAENFVGHDIDNALGLVAHLTKFHMATEPWESYSFGTFRDSNNRQPFSKVTAVAEKFGLSVFSFKI